MESIYKIGDQVKIAKRTGEYGNYRFGFSYDMTRYVGQIFTIKNVKPANKNATHLIKDDCHKYILEGIDNYMWASSMLEPVDTGTISEQSKLNIKVRNMKYKLNFNN